MVLLHGRSHYCTLLRRGPRRFIISITFGNAVNGMPICSSAMYQQVRNVRDTFTCQQSVQRRMKRTVHMRTKRPFSIHVKGRRLITIVLRRLIMNRIRRHAFHTRLIRRHRSRSRPINFRGKVLVRSSLIVTAFHCNLYRAFRRGLIRYCYNTAKFLRHTSNAKARTRLRRQFRSRPTLSPVRRLATAESYKVTLRCNFMFTRPYRIQHSRPRSMFIFIQVTTVMMTILLIRVFNRKSTFLTFLTRMIRNKIARDRSPNTKIRRTNSVKNILRTIKRRSNLTIIVRKISKGLNRRRTSLHNNSRTSRNSILFATTRQALVVFTITKCGLRTPNSRKCTLLSAYQTFAFHKFRASCNLFLRTFVTRPSRNSIINVAIGGVVRQAELRNRRHVINVMNRVLIMRHSKIARTSATIFTNRSSPYNSSTVATIGRQRTNLRIIFKRFSSQAMISIPFQQNSINSRTTRFLSP